MHTGLSPVQLAAVSATVTDSGICYRSVLRHSYALARTDARTCYQREITDLLLESRIRLQKPLAVAARLPR
eukprot:1405561-Rhodomonas_salina.1